MIIDNVPSAMVTRDPATNRILINLTDSAGPDCGLCTTLLSPFGAPAGPGQPEPAAQLALTDPEIHTIHQAFAAPEGSPGDIERNVLDSVSNTYMDSVVIPVLTLIKTVSAYIKDPDTKIDLICYDGSIANVQLYGIRSIEIEHGHNVFLSRIMEHALAGAFPGRIQVCARVRAPRIAAPFAMRLLRAAAGTMLTAKYFVHVIVNARVNRAARNDAAPAAHTIIRTPYHEELRQRFSAEKAQALHTPVLLPHLFSRRFKPVTGQAPARAPTLSQALSGWWRMRRDFARISRRRASLYMVCPIADQRIHFDLGALLKEVTAIPAILLNRYVLGAYLAQSGSCRHLISFEQFGHNAFCEAQAARENDARLINIQCVTLPPRPIYGFPVGDVFFSDSRHNFLEQTHNYPGAAIRYAGVPIPDLAQEVASQPDVDIGFYTQPYERDVTERILEVLIGFARDAGQRVMVRLHPRDHKSAYAIDWDSHDHVFIDHDPVLINSLRRCRLVVTRTSAVSRTAAALGVPVVHTLFSAYDRSNSLDYLSVPESRQLNVDCEDDLRHVLALPAPLLAQLARQKRKALFDDLFLDDLARAISQISRSAVP